MRAALYARVSTDRQAGDDRNSLPVQRSRFADWCVQRDAEPVAEYTDAETGRVSTRPGYQQMLTDARAGKFDAIVVRHLDRFGRDQWEIMGRIGELRALGVEVDATDEALHDFIYVALSAWKADAESKRLGERVRAALIRQASQGRKTGRAPYGYRYDGQQLVIDADAAAIVRRIFRDLLEHNKGPRAIAVGLNADGIPSPSQRHWNQNSIRKVLRRRAYVGDLVYAEVVVEEAHDPIIDRETFARAQERMERMRTLPGGRTQSGRNLLTGLAWCGYCGGRMQASSNRSGARRYACARKYQYDGCSTWNRHDAEDLERRVLAQLAAQDTAHPETGPDRVADAEERVAEWERRITSLDAELRSNLDLYRAEALTLDQLRIANQSVHDQRTAAEEARARAAADLTRARAITAPQPDVVALSAAIESLPAPRAKALLQTALESITVYEDRVEVTLR